LEYQLFIPNYSSQNKYLYNKSIYIKRGGGIGLQPEWSKLIKRNVVYGVIAFIPKVKVVELNVLCFVWRF
jgi:hypothetical protein